jgi:hypothetical protein
MRPGSATKNPTTSSMTPFDEVARRDERVDECRPHAERVCRQSDDRREGPGDQYGDLGPVVAHEVEDEGEGADERRADTEGVGRERHDRSERARDEDRDRLPVRAEEVENELGGSTHGVEGSGHDRAERLGVLPGEDDPGDERGQGDDHDADRIRRERRVQQPLRRGDGDRGCLPCLHRDVEREDRGRHREDAAGDDLRRRLVLGQEAEDRRRDREQCDERRDERDRQPAPSSRSASARTSRASSTWMPAKCTRSTISEQAFVGKGRPR